MDNLPVALIPTFSELYEGGRGEVERAALLVDAREGAQIDQLPGIYRKLSSERAATLVFIEASDAALQRRFSETRRPHPLGKGGSIADGIREERRRMAPIRRLADVIIDTTKFNVHELRQFIIDRFQKPGAPSAAGVRGQFRISLWNSRRCGSGFRRALSAEPALRSAPPPLQRQRPSRRALHSLVPADGRISAPHRKPLGDI